MKRKLGLAVALFPFTLVLALAGWKCSTPLHEQADILISTWSGAVKEEQAKHLTECVPQPNTPVCKAINVAGASLNILITATDTYCSGPTPAGQKAWKEGGPCVPVANASQALQAAIGNFNQALNDAKALGVLK